MRTGVVWFVGSDRIRMSARRKRLPLAVTGLAAALLVIPVGGIAQVQVTRTGVVDLDKIVRAYFRESEALRTYEARREEAIAERDRIEGEIRTLEQALIDARQTEDRRVQLRIEQQLFDTREHLLQFVRVKNDQLQREYEGLKTSDRFVGDLAEAFRYVAETLGFALIRGNDDVYYWDPDIDLTDEVIAELARRAARR